MSELERRVLSLLAAAAPRGRRAAVDRATRLQADLGLDSIALLSVVFRFQEEFGIDLARIDPGMSLAGLRTAGDVIEAAAAILGGRAGEPTQSQRTGGERA